MYIPKKDNRQARWMAREKAMSDRPEESGMFEKNGIPVVYTDGSCTRNGYANAKAGAGVFWGPDDARNGMYPVTGVQTNNRAKYTAALALEILRIYVITDCKLIFNTMYLWLDGWKEAGWINRNGVPVANRDLIEEIESLVAQMKCVSVTSAAILDNS
ncbi:unnamed protein product [Caenorhabditis sp. 36 PRJEB53466]|nr:unnamed protein product [Caenorhabditis sp. 36 PRJEB53466]